MDADEIVWAPREHDLKCWPEYYDAVERGDKPFEIRKWDRPYHVGDTLLLRRYDPETQNYTGQQMRRKITYLLGMTYLPGDERPHFAGYVAIGLSHTALIESLQAQLAESQRRERAAVEDWKIYEECGQCDVCKYGEGGGCTYPEGGRCSFTWRGPQEDEK